MNIWQWQAECSIVSSDPVHVLVRGVQMVMGCTMDDGQSLILASELIFTEDGGMKKRLML
jgi:hypothetical protein